MILGPGPGSSIADDSNLKRMSFKLVPGPGAPPTAWNEFPTFRVMEIVVRDTYYIYHIP